MRIFVCEFVTGGGLRGRVADGRFAPLLHEGELMARALCDDLTTLPGVQVTLARDRALPPPPAPARDVTIAWVGDDPWPAWEAAINAHDAVWPIAPETGGVLERLSALTLAAGRTLLGSHPEAVAVTTSKSATARHLAAAGLPVVMAEPVEGMDEDTTAATHGWIVKPDDGAGAEDVRFLPDSAALAAWRAGADTAGMIVQPFVPGEPASLSMLCRDGRAWLLSINRQTIATNPAGRLSYRGGEAGALNARAGELRPIAEAVAAALPGLWGYVGVDLVLGSDGPVVIEVNPRLTTSCVALRPTLGRSLAGLVLALLSGDPGVPDRLPDRAASFVI